MQQKAGALARIGVPNFFERPGYAEFYRAISGKRIAHVSRLDIGAVAGAGNLGLVMCVRYYHLLASYTNDAAIMRHGPGAAHLMEIMRHAIERGCTVFDFTIGDEPYKPDWCEERQTLYDHLSARTLKRGRSQPFAGHAGKARDQGKSRALGRVLQAAFCR
jgi:CelD/BcsL family acetyltransferase involved in cellulose biosynthesis